MILGLLSGVGHLPAELADAVRQQGYEVVAIGVVPEIDPGLFSAADVYYDINIGKIGKIISTLKKHEVTHVTMIGKVSKEVLYKAGAIVPDLRAIKLLASLPDRKDDTIMNAIVKELEGEGIEVMDQADLIKPLLPKPGVLTKRAPTPEELADMEFGFEVAKSLGGLDIGQTVVVKNKAVMALEAIEGTDACILRGGFLGCGGVIVAKTAKPNQDKRFDMPGFGANTVKSMVSAGATGIVLEAGSTIIADREKAIKLADENNITILVK
ncbi:MAG: UDP-2,3-diacylglucosamine diphosphatase LpxI [Phascolarctobacterium sp.]|nr:UDP-2,3-diacylglucosamine diphosphatase LpxI [Phascolarctobacterium sp.]